MVKKGDYVNKRLPYSQCLDFFAIKANIEEKIDVKKQL
jgi:hypothetical protein